MGVENLPGVEDGLVMGYHETTTQAFMRLIHPALRKCGPFQDSHEFCERNPELLDRRVLFCCFTRDRIMEPAAKVGFVESDIAPLVVELAGMAADFSKTTLKREFGKNFHVRYSTVFEKQRDDLVLVKGGPGSRLLTKVHRLSSIGKDRTGKPLKVLSPEMRKVFGTFDGKVSIQRSPPRWVEPPFVETAVKFVTGLT